MATGVVVVTVNRAPVSVIAKPKVCVPPGGSRRTRRLEWPQPAFSGFTSQADFAAVPNGSGRPHVGQSKQRNKLRPG